MSRIEDRLREDRELRDAARAVLLADLDHLRTNLSVKGVSGRIGDRIGEGAKDVLEIAKDSAKDNRGIIAALIAAIALWFAREPILEILGLDDSEEEQDNPAAEDQMIDPDPATPPGDDDEQ